MPLAIAKWYAWKDEAVANARACAVSKCVSTLGRPSMPRDGQRHAPVPGRPPPPLRGNEQLWHARLNHCDCSGASVREPLQVLLDLMSGSDLMGRHQIVGSWRVGSSCSI